MKRTSCFLVLFLILNMGLPTVSLAAAPSCQQIFDPSYISKSDHEILERLNLPQFFQIKKSSTGALQLFDQRNSGLIGELKIYHVKHLYEWADLETQQSWYQNGGITKQHMKEILAEPAQSYGRGYYVSTNPTDSMSYGNAITIFKVKKPLITIKVQNTYYSSDHQMVTYLSELGFDGFTNGSTWLSLIRHEHLQIETNEFISPQLAELKDEDRKKFIQSSLDSGFYETVKPNFTAGYLSLSSISKMMDKYELQNILNNIISFFPPEEMDAAKSKIAQRIKYIENNAAKIEERRIRQEQAQLNAEFKKFKIKNTQLSQVLDWNDNDIQHNPGQQADAVFQFKMNLFKDLFSKANDTEITKFIDQLYLKQPTSTFFKVTEFLTTIQNHLISRPQSKRQSNSYKKSVVDFLTYVATKGDVYFLGNAKSSGIDINTQDQDGETALMRAVRSSKHQPIATLNYAGADKTIRNNYNQSAYDIAIIDPKLKIALQPYMHLLY